MSTFTFSDKNVLDSHLSADDGSHGFTTSTSSGFIRRKTTTLVHDIKSYPTGAIDWRSRTFEIGGVSGRISDLKSGARFFSSTREWRWGHSGHQYTVKSSSKQWTATSNGLISATMNLYQPHIFRKSEPASISFSSDLSKEEMVFLFLVFIYSEIRREEKSRAAINNANASAAASASASAASAAGC